MSLWDIKHDSDNGEEPERAIPDLTEEDLKVALINYIHKYGGNYGHKDDGVAVIGYNARKTDLSRHKQIHTYSLNANCTTSSGINHQVKLLLKMQNPNLDEKDRKFLFQRQLFLKEIAFFGCVIPKVKEFMPWHSSEIPILECFLAKSKDEAMVLGSTQVSPCCFLPGPTDMIILEDLHRSGYYTTNRDFNIEQVKLAMKSLAVMHAMTSMLNRRGYGYNLSLAQAFPWITEETYYNKYLNNDWHTKFSAGLEIISAIGPLLNAELLLPGRDITGVVTVMMRDLWGVVEDALKPSSTHLNALCLINCDYDSFAFCNDSKTSARACKLISFQDIKYCRPAVDIAQLLYNCTSQELRTANESYLLDVYHDEFLEVTTKCHVKFHPNLSSPTGLLSLAELKQAYYECEIVGATQYAITLSFACLFEYDPYTSDPQENLYRKARNYLQQGGRIPAKQELRQRANKAFTCDPRYRAAMHKAIANVLECLARFINCNRPDLHRVCPHVKAP